MRQLVERVRGLLSHPRQALPLTLADSGAPRDVFLCHVALLAALGPVALFLTDGVLGAWHASVEIFNTTIPGGWVRAPVPALVETILCYLLSVGAWAVLATAMAFVAPWFGGIRDRSGALKAAAHALTPVWLAGATFLFGSIPYFTWMPNVALVAGVAWAVYLAVIALPLHLGTPDRKAPGHALTSLGITTVVVTALYFLISSVVYSFWSSRVT